MLKFPPIKPKPLPRGLIYESRADNRYLLADVKSGKLVGEMSLIKRPCDNLSFYNNRTGASTLHLYSLYTYERGKGWADYLIDFAKMESYRRGCQGRCSLVAYHSGMSPHTLYKKKGFITTNDAYNKFLDDCNAQGRRLYYEPAKSMFIPIVESSTSEPCLEGANTSLDLPIKMNFFERLQENFRFCYKLLCTALRKL